MKVVTVVGARPQFIKCAPVSRELRKQHTGVLVHTGRSFLITLIEGRADLGVRARTMTTPNSNTIARPHGSRI